MKFLIDLLLAFFYIGVGEGDADPDPNADLDPPEDEIVIDDPNVDPPADPLEGDEPPPELTAAQKEAKVEKDRADRYEREIAEMRRANPPKAQEAHDFLTAEERTKLADPKTEPTEKWQIESNKILRQNTASANLALAQAHDVSDRATFAAIATTNPALHKKYAARVEERLAELRSRGSNAPRETILDYLVGKDMREGKFAKKAKPAAKADAGVARGKLPGARSDVGGRSAMTEHEKRAKRLENVPI